MEYPLYGANMITVKDILTLANTEYEEMRFYGGTVIVKLFWQCDLDSLNPCSPSIMAYKVDTINNRGYAVRHPIYHLEAFEKRTLKNYQGIMFKFISKGVGYKFTLDRFLIVLLSVIGLQSFIAFIISYVLLQVFGEKKHYSSQVITKLKEEQLTK